MCCRMGNDNGAPDNAHDGMTPHECGRDNREKAAGPPINIIILYRDNGEFGQRSLRDVHLIQRPFLPPSGGGSITLQPLLTSPYLCDPTSLVGGQQVPNGICVGGVGLHILNPAKFWHLTQTTLSHYVSVWVVSSIA